MSRKPFVTEPFTNEFGQVIKPGYPIVTVTQGYNHSTKIRMGTYVGLRMGTNYHGNKHVQHVVCRVRMTKWKYDYETGKGEHVEIDRLTCLPRKRIYLTMTPMSALR